MSTNKYIQIAVEEVGSQVNLARSLGVSPTFVHQLLNGRRPVPANLCLRIEVLSKNKVSRKDLLPNDWKDIWPELECAPQPT